MGRDDTNRLAAFLAWWGSELRALVPSPFRTLFGSHKRHLVVRLDGHTVEATLDSTHGPKISVAAAEVTPDDWGNLGNNFADAMRAVDPGSVKTVLVIGASQVVRRHLRLPPTPERDLKGLLSFEIERHTPFRPDEVYLAYRVHRDDAAETMGVTVNVAPRRVLDPLIKSLSDIGFAPTQTVLGDDDVRGLAVGELSRPAPQGRVAFAAIVLLVVAATAAMSPLLRLEAIAEQTRNAAREELRLSEDAPGAANETAALRFLIERRQSRVSALVVLEELARILPDGAWLTSMSQAGQVLTLEGQTRESAQLIPRLEASPYFGEVSFAAPTTREGTGERERFAFSLRVAPRP